MKKWKFGLAGVIIAGMLAAMPMGANAEGEVQIDQDTFPDEAFRTYVSKNFDTDENGQLSVDEINAVKKITVGDSGVRDLTGLGCFSELEELYCHRIYLKQLDVRENQKLKKLYCWGNDLTELDLSNNTEITHLACYSNKLTELDLQNLSELYLLWCSANPLGELDISNCMLLDELHCAENELSQLDVSHNQGLRDLYCRTNNLTELDVKNNTELQSLNFFENRIQTIDVHNNLKLRSLICYDNPITEIDVSDNEELLSLDCFDTSVKEINTSNNPKLQTLRCNGLGLTELDVSKNPGLTWLECRNNRLTVLDLSNNSKLERLYFDGNSVTEIDLTGLSELVEFNCSSNQISFLDTSHNPKLWKLSCDYNKLSTLELSNNTRLTELTCSGNQLTKLDLGMNQALSRLRINDNDISLIDLRNSNEWEAGSGFDRKDIIADGETIIILSDDDLGWYTIDGNKYYVADDGITPKSSHFLTGEQVIGDETYQFSDEGILIGEVDGDDEQRQLKRILEGYTAYDTTDMVGVGNPRSAFAQIPSVEHNGIYTLKNGMLLLVSAKDGSVRTVANFCPVEGDKIKNYFVQGDTLYLLKCRLTGVVDRYYSICLYDLSAQTIIKTINLEGNDFYAIGADTQGRMLLGDQNNIYLLDKDGVELCKYSTTHRVRTFVGYDSENGNFYFEGKSGSYYTCLYAGRIVGNEISVPEDHSEICTLRMIPYYRYGSADLSDGKHLIWSTLYRQCYVGALDSHQYDFVNTLKADIAIGRNDIEKDGEKIDNYSWGVRALYYPVYDSYIIYMNNNTVMEFDRSGEILAVAKTKEHVFSMFMLEDTLILFELNDAGECTMEKIPWKGATKLTLSGSGSSVESLKSIQLDVERDGYIDETIKWTSDTPSVATVDQNGKVYGLKNGEAVITASLRSGVKGSYKVTVTGDAGDLVIEHVADSHSVISSNAGKNNYSTYASVMKSYMFEEPEGTICRVEYVDKKIVIERYSTDGTLMMQKKLTPEMDIFGGFYVGKDARYLVYGQTNASESDETEVIRVVKYDKWWNRMKSASVYEINTYVPFDAGCLRMTEYNGKLYIHTSRTMYKTSDGNHHQANLTLVIDEADMTVSAKQYKVSNLTQGYVSHSFNQFILENDGYIYRVDHSEASVGIMSGSYLSVTGITLSAFDSNNNPDKLGGVTVPLMTEPSGNYTGFSIGGFEISTEKCLIAYNQDISGSRNRNAFITVTDTLLNRSKQVQLSDFTAQSGLSAGVPQLVKLNDYLFLVLWEVKESKGTGKEKTQGVVVNGAGEICTDVADLPSVRLSDCQPIQCSDGNVRWYYTENSMPALVTLDPMNMDAIIKTGWEEDESDRKYYYDTDGTRVTGWAEIDGKKYYFNDDGVMQTGAQKIEGKVYYFNADGVMQTGVLKLNGKVYYLDPETGAMHTGWLTYEGKRYFFDGKGVMQTGVVEVAGQTYYFNGNGTQKTGVFKTTKGVFYLNPDNNGAMHIGWIEYGKYRYYFDVNGKMVTGAKMIDGEIYYFNKSGQMQIGTVRVKGNYYYLDPITGAMVTGWLKLNGKTYYLQENGILAIDCTLKIGGKKYTFNSKGVCTNP